jgi:excinuclease UvrABC nuclease subunit
VKTVDKYYVSLQDGIIRETPASFTNFYEFEVNLTDTEKEILRKLLNSKNVIKQYEFLYHVCIKKSDKYYIKKILKKDIIN